MNPTPTQAISWLDVFKNLLLIGIGIFILIHETLDVGLPSILLLIIAAGCLGLPVLDYLSGKRD